MPLHKIHSPLDPANQAEALNHPVVSTYFFNIWGPLFAGIFEEGVRYIIISRSIIKSDRKLLPLTMGLGWSFGEIIVLNLINNPFRSEFGEFYWLGVLERASATLLHISFTFLVLYSVINKDKLTLAFAMFIHFVVDFVLLIWILEIGNLDLSPSLSVILLELRRFITLLNL